MALSLLRGSSPLTRGKLARRSGFTRAVWLIPAHAGKTASCTGPRERSWAHPRSRGENGQLARGGVRGPGSSPLTRGKRRKPPGVLERNRLIPAHAGKTESEGVRTIGVSAHPRSRGENANGEPANVIRPGSSPLTRGKHRGVRVRPCVERLIPAHAGKTQT